MSHRTFGKVVLFYSCSWG